MGKFLRNALFGIAVGDALGVPHEKKTKRVFQVFGLGLHTGTGSKKNVVGRHRSDARRTRQSRNPKEGGF